MNNTDVENYTKKDKVKSLWKTQRTFNNVKRKNNVNKKEQNKKLRIYGMM